MSSFGGTVKLTGESEYKRALKEIGSNLKFLGSEMKLLSSSYDKNDKSSEKLSSTNKLLNKQIEEQEKKVKILKDALEKSKNETGESSETTRKWQIDLNNAQAKLNNMKNSVNDYGNETEKSSEKTLKLGDIIKANLISDAIKNGLSALASGMKKIGEGIMGVVKDSLTAYGEYEQLVGGVETLFGDSADQILEYANNAYKTAGLSANDYMETVTSFSASLLQSLDGDTKKAAEKADIAVTDMSDNANKMGTSMESLQNAYQGFAKGQFNMLDNLKLGYGGTKQEMERLLEDATKLSGIEYDIDSYSDIVDAIHVIQTEMEIAGTTQKEASSTIQGSLLAMQSAWGNLIAGLGDSNADFDQLVGNLVDSVLTVVDNVMPILMNILSEIPSIITKLLQAISDNFPMLLDMVSELLESILNLITQNLPDIVQKGAEMLISLIQGISSNIDSVVSTVMEVVNILINTIVQNLPMVIEMGIQLLVSLINGISNSLPNIIPVMIDAVILMVETLLDNIDLIIDAGINLIMSLADGLIKALPKLIDKIPVIIDKLVMAITNNMPKIIEMGIKLTIQLSIGIIKAIPQLVSKVPQIITSLVNGLKNGLGKMATIGKDLIKGLWNGIKDMTGWIMGKIKGFGSSILKGIKGVFGIHSPSTVFRDEVGKNLAFGIGEGFSGEMANISKEMQNAIPREFDTNINAKIGTSSISTYDMMISALKVALSDVKVVMDDREMGTFVTNTVGKAVYGY